MESKKRPRPFLAVAEVFIHFSLLRLGPPAPSSFLSVHFCSGTRRRPSRFVSPGGKFPGSQSGLGGDGDGDGDGQIPAGCGGHFNIWTTDLWGFIWHGIPTFPRVSRPSRRSSGQPRISDPEPIRRDLINLRVLIRTFPKTLCGSRITCVPRLQENPARTGATRLWSWDLSPSFAGILLSR